MKKQERDELEKFSKDILEPHEILLFARISLSWCDYI